MSTSFHLGIVNGPNLDRLGLREPHLYGTTTYPELVARCEAWGADNGHTVNVYQSAGEGELVTLLHRLGDTCAGVLLNAGAYTHTSVALRDAVLSVTIPVVELHLTNPDSRESFRRQNLLADVVVARVAGFGVAGYMLGLSGLETLLKEKT